MQPLLQLKDNSLPYENLLLGSSQKESSAPVGANRFYVAPGASALLVANGENLAFLGLQEGSRGDVAAWVDGQEVYLRCGELLLISPSEGMWRDLSPLSNLDLRRQAEHKTKSGIRLLTGEFSFASLFETTHLFRNLAKSSDSAERRFYAKIAKNAAVRHVLGVKYGPFAMLR